MELENMAANAAVDSAPDTGGAESSAVGSVAASPETPPPETGVSGTKAFSDRLNKMSAQRTDAAIKSLGMTNHYTNSPIETFAQMQEYQTMRQADESGGDPESAVELSRVRAELEAYRQREAEFTLSQQEAAIKADAYLSGIYDEYYEEVMEALEGAAARGAQLDLDSALRAVMMLHFDDIQSHTMENAKAAALEELRSRNAASPGPLGGAPAGDAPKNWADMPADEFKQHVAAAKRGDYRKS